MKLAFSLITLLLLDQYTSVSPFLTPSLLPSTTSLFAKTKKKQPAAPKPARGFAPPSLTPKPVKFNVAASLARLETTYNDLTTEGFRSSISEEKEVGLPYSVCQEFVITMKSLTSAYLPDWIPVAQLSFLTPSTHADLHAGSALSTAVTAFKRELRFAAVTGSKEFERVDSSDLVYAVEPLSDFYTYVYDAVYDRKEKPVSEGGVMNKAVAREVLGVSEEEGGDPSILKSKYRKLTMKYHPDRFVASSEEEKKEGGVKFNEIVKAYESLSSGDKVSEGGSWYESLGRKSGRNDFKEVALGEGKEAVERVESGKLRAAIRAVDTDIVGFFVSQIKNRKAQGV